MAFDYVKYQSLFAKFGMSPEGIGKLMWYWQQKHRFYHSEEHLSFLINNIENIAQKNEINAEEKDILLMTAFFHDVIYDPTSFDNEEKSEKLFRSLTVEKDDTKLISNLILETKNHKPTNRLSEIFIELDLSVLTKSSSIELINYEKKIMKEFQYADYKIYKNLRIAFLESFLKSNNKNQNNIEFLIDFLKDFRPKIGVYAGSFSPFHFGHLNILEKAEKIFDKIIIARGVNPEKTSQLEFIDYSNLHELKYRQKEDFTGLLTDYLTEKEETADITLVRGLRNGDDLDYEVNQLRFMEDMKPELKVVFIRCDKQYEHISSSAIRNLEKISKGLGNKYFPVA